MRKSLIYVPVLGLAFISFVFLISDTAAWKTRIASAQDEQAKKVSFAKDLQVLEFDSMLELQNYMKGVTEALGVTCKACHDLTDFSKTVEGLHKEEAREMMKLTKELNENFFKDAASPVTCFTCHRGFEHPANTKAEWEKQTKKE